MSLMSCCELLPLPLFSMEACSSVPSKEIVETDTLDVESVGFAIAFGGLFLRVEVWTASALMLIGTTLLLCLEKEH